MSKEIKWLIMGLLIAVALFGFLLDRYLQTILQTIG